SIDFVIAFEDLAKLQAAVFKCLQDRLAEVLRGPNISRPRDERKSPMPQRPKVVDRLGYSAGVIDPDAAQVALRALLIEENSRDVMRHQSPDVLCVHHRSHHGCASYAVLDHLSHCRVDALGSIFSVTKQNFETFRQGRLFET